MMKLTNSLFNQLDVFNKQLIENANLSSLQYFQKLIRKRLNAISSTYSNELDYIIEKEKLYDL